MKRLIFPVAVLAFFSDPLEARAGSPLPDYEAEARALFAVEPEFERRWPVEFHVRIMEGLLQDFERAIADLGEEIGSDQFAETVEHGWAERGGLQRVTGGLRRANWSLSSPMRLSAAESGDLWRRHLAGFRFVERVVLKVKLGSVPEAGRFDAVVKVEVAGRATGEDAGWRRDHGLAEASFVRTGSGWRISRFVLTRMSTDVVEEKLFEDVTDQALAGLPPPAREMLGRRSVSDLIIRRDFSGWQQERAGEVFIDHTAADTHPGVVVVDVDGDGRDDLLVWDVLGDTVLLRNVDGLRFEDATDRFGLRFRDVSAVVFADLNNDGIQDVVVGRFFQPSEIRIGSRSTEGVLAFLPASINQSGILPSGVSGISVADVDRDGRLDIYFATTSRYSFPDLPVREGSLAGRTIIDQPGPRNVLLRNLGGGKWEDVTSAAGLELNRLSFQGAFGDYDDDGWPDLFVANDFAPANLYRNLGGLRFRDVSRETGADRVFFGMGGSWGDVDGDGDLDLYVAAMQSGAGQRIFGDDANFSPIYDPALRDAHRHSVGGNRLLRNEGGGRFTDATAEPAFAEAANSGWAWGAQLVDLDGDGRLDAYSPNGFYSVEGDDRNATFRDT